MVKQRLNNWLQELDADAVDEYNSLRRSLQRNSGFGIFFTQCSPAIGSNIIAEIKQDISDKKIEVLHFEQAIDSLYNKIINLPNLRDIDILFISGLEHSLIEYENNTFNSQEDTEKNTVKRLTQDKQSVPRLLGYMNLQRDRFRDDLDISLVFIVPFFGIDYFIKRAPDFFDWRSGFFRFVPQKDYLTNIDFDDIFAKNIIQSHHELLDLRTLSKELELESTEHIKVLHKDFILLVQCYRYEEAIASCDKCLAINPNEDIAWLYRGIALMWLERYEEAISDYDKCLSIDSGEDAAWLYRSWVLEELERYEEAVSSYEKYLAINPNEDIVWLNLGSVLKELERYEEEIASYDKCLAINPEQDTAWFNRGIALGELERYEEAISSYDKCLAINPEQDTAWFNRGIALGELERYEEAISSYDKCLAINPEQDSAWFNRGIDLRILERYEEAISSYDKCLAINPEKDTAWLNRGVDLGRLEKYEEAISSYDKCLAINPEKDTAWLNRGVSFRQLGMMKEANASIRKAVELNPKLPLDLLSNQFHIIKSKLNKILLFIRLLLKKLTAFFNSFNS